VASEKEQVGRKSLFMTEKFLFRLKALFRRGRVEDDLRKELSFHLQNEIDKKTREKFNKGCKSSVPGRFVHPSKFLPNEALLLRVLADFTNRQLFYEAIDQRKCHRAKRHDVNRQGPE